jgi:hypothetical protein
MCVIVISIVQYLTMHKTCRCALDFFLSFVLFFTQLYTRYTTLPTLVTMSENIRLEAQQAIAYASQHDVQYVQTNRFGGASHATSSTPLPIVRR